MNPDAVSERIPPKRLFAFLIMVFGMFMSILDIQIVSASLNEIQAGLSASQSEVSWVQTSYLIAEVIAIPLSGFMSRALGTRLLFAISASGFTIASFFCGFASTLEQMMIWRAIQGFLGAGMIPTVFASAYCVFPRSKFYIVGPIIGLVATLAPTIGPTVGGIITDWMSWHWLFFINIVPGIGITIGVLILCDFDKPDFKLLKHFDWWGLLFMAAFLGTLEYVLEEGPRYEWLQDTSIAVCAAICAMSAIAFFWRVFTAREPIVDLTTFSDRNFGIGCLIALFIGVGLYGLTYMYPRYLAEVRGYSALMIGETMFVSGVTHVPGRADHRTADDDRRLAPDDRVRPDHVRARLIPDDVDHQGLRLLGAVRAANPARHRHDVRDGADQHHCAGHAAAGTVEERVRPVQPDAQSRRCDRACGHQSGAERAHRPAYRAAAGAGDLGQCAPPPRRSTCSPRKCRAWATRR